MSRVLIMPFASGRGLAHAGACHALARGLSGRGHEVILSYSGCFPEFVIPGTHRLVQAYEIPPEDVPHMDRWYRDPSALEAAVEADRKLMEREAVEVVISDSRPSTPIAAYDAGLPDVGLCHFLGFTRWSAARRLAGHRWLRRTRHPVMSFGRWWDGRGRDPNVTAALDAVIAEVRGAHGLEPDTQALTAGTVVACTSTPLLDPAEGLPPNWRYVGHLAWSVGGPDAALPELGSRPVVYVTQGSTGNAATLFRTVRDLARLPVEVLVTTAELCDPHELAALAPNVTAARYLSGHACLKRAAVAVIHGGHLTASDAHLTGTPVVVVPAIADHWIWAARVQRAGTGIPVEGPLTPGRIRRAVQRVLGDQRYRQRMAQVSGELSRWDAVANVDAIVHELVK